MYLALILTYSLICSIGVVILTGTFLLISENIRQSLSSNLLSYSMGFLLGRAFLSFIPAALTISPDLAIFSAVMLGLILFFIFEKIMIFRNGQKSLDKEVVNAVMTTGIIEPRVGSTILIGDSLQNFINGIIITSTFFQSIYLGIFTSLVIFSEQIPQKTVDFIILLESGYSRKKSLHYNSLASLNTLIGAVLAYFFLSSIEKTIPYLLSLTAASFIYISIGEIAPKLNIPKESLFGEHNKLKVLKEDLKKIIFILFGIVTIFILEKYH